MSMVSTAVLTKLCGVLPLSLQRVVHTEEEWKELLTPGQFYILRQAGTELPRSRCGFAVVQLLRFYLSRGRG